MPRRSGATALHAGMIEAAGALVAPCAADRGYTAVATVGGPYATRRKPIRETDFVSRNQARLHGEPEEGPHSI